MDNQTNREVEVKILLDQEITFGDINDVLAGYHHSDWQEYHMVADYLDTVDGDLNKEKVAYRIRRENEKIVASLKANLENDQGVFTRYEANEEVESDQPNLQVFADDKKFGSLIRKLADKEIISKLKMDFIRQAATYEYGSAKIEVAVDRGLITKGSKTGGIWELELELKEGPVEDLHKLASALVDFFQVEIAAESKYERGLGL